MSRTMIIRFDEDGRQVVLTAVDVEQAMTILNIIEQPFRQRVATAYNIGKALDALQKQCRFTNDKTAWWDKSISMAVRSGGPSSLTVSTSKPVPARLCVFCFYACTNQVEDQHAKIVRDLKMFISGIPVGVCQYQFESIEKHKPNAPKTGRIQS